MRKGKKNEWRVEKSHIEAASGVATGLATYCLFCEQIFLCIFYLVVVHTKWLHHISMISGFYYWALVFCFAFSLHISLDFPSPRFQLFFLFFFFVSFVFFLGDCSGACVDHFVWAHSFSLSSFTRSLLNLSFGNARKDDAATGWRSERKRLQKWNEANVTGGNDKQR